LDQPFERIAAETTRKRRPADMPSRSMGLGWHIDSENALDILWHNGGAGGSSSYVAFLMEPRVGVVVLSNSSNSVDELGHTVLYLLVRH
jgi:CubicO group peptidase (beta-lactamase class C family)